ncbi:rhodanese-like domain-containing protein [Ulvibacterium sp.]|uniref:rhodanese-like domain-containing protein n=1 Tax=Ulvibacterium sp. TaxID=2665914 RepID=UPI003BA87B0E
MKFLPLIVIFLSLNCCYGQIKSKPITEFSQKDIKDGILIDVRTPKEFNMGHLENALNINWLGTGFQEHFDTIPKDKKLYLYCKKGGRSAKAQKLLDSLGYQNVVNLEGGYDHWKIKKKF